MRFSNVNFYTENIHIITIRAPNHVKHKKNLPSRDAFPGLKPQLFAYFYFSKPFHMTIVAPISDEANVQ